jgi:ABC-type antimicrobial peptide transport system permease subunit
MAMGARPRDVLRLVLRQGMAPVVLGVGLGIAVAFWASRLVAGLLFGVSASDPLTFSSIPLLLAVVALAASWLPARKATRVDPLNALRYE